MNAYAVELDEVPGVGGVMPGPTGPATISEDGSLAKIDLLLDSSPYANESLDLVEGRCGTPRTHGRRTAPPRTSAA